MSIPDERSIRHVGVLLVAHGSRDPDGVAEALQFMAAIREHLREKSCDIPVQESFLELTQPDIRSAVAALAAAGVRQVLVCPLLLFAAAHIHRDIPAQLSAARAALENQSSVPADPAPDSGHSLKELGHLSLELEFTVMPAVGVDDEFMQAAVSRIQETRQPGCGGDDAAAVLLSRGNRDENAWRSLERVAAGVQAHTQLTRVIPASLTGLGSRLEPALDEALASGARHITVMPYLWFTGVLLKSLPDRVSQWGAQHPGCAVRLARHLGMDSRLVAVIGERILSHLEGAAVSPKGRV
ncbi:sirohydrochlorin chelatase [Alicyclobacillus herbarius]|uniref:sirohydrochlorin chelatase n=1 Tax=Alicyclobacillus herbarius TaxID=122960 RepID=UPI0004787A5D|nr:sirohydrochlorin chelatase [Alicyclobacillus herbarius]